MIWTRPGPCIFREALVCLASILLLLGDPSAFSPLTCCSSYPMQCTSDNSFGEPWAGSQLVKVLSFQTIVEFWRVFNNLDFLVRWAGHVCPLLHSQHVGGMALPPQTARLPAGWDIVLARADLPGSQDKAPIVDQLRLLQRAAGWVHASVIAHVLTCVGLNCLPACLSACSV